jgi:hypothetical protein
MTRNDVEKLAAVFPANERYERWLECRTHDLSALPLTDSGERYCETCCCLWSPQGELLNQPHRTGS